SRVRQITLDDTHVFCRPDQVAAEVARALRSALDAQRTLGVQVDEVRLSRRDGSDAYLGDAASWERGEAALRAAAAEIAPEHDLPVVEAEGEAAFYGPKLDLQVLDGRGHAETIATVQLDFTQPERFDLGYTAANGSRQRPVMIHRGTVGSMERVAAALVERYLGRLPLWLAPTQVCVLPVGPEQDEAARALADDLAAAGLRAVVRHEGSLGARVRASRGRRDAVIAVVGPAEVDAGAVRVTDPAAGWSGTVDRARAVAVLDLAARTRAAVPAW
ncbi:MAG TPA: aminoacyl--tRNA ligase-related protein, partial [Cellulomonas sp.]